MRVLRLRRGLATTSARTSSHYAVDSAEGHWNSGKPGLGYTIREKEGYFPPAPHDTLHDLRIAMVLTLERLGIPCEFHHHEVASGGQCEIDLRYQTLTRMADQVMTYKYVVKNVARAAGKTVTFMPKPLFGDNGSGMHTHQSLWKEGTPLMADKSGYAGLSQLARGYVAGLLAHAPALLAFCAPTTNSYRRLVPGYEAPVNLVYSQRNRSACIRIPMYSDSPKAKRVEFRCPDAAANPYLAFAAMLMAGLDGIEKGLEPGEPADYDLFEEDRGRIAQVPGSLDEALDALESRPRVPDRRRRLQRGADPDLDRLEAGERGRPGRAQAASRPSSRSTSTRRPVEIRELREEDWPAVRGDLRAGHRRQERDLRDRGSRRGASWTRSQLDGHRWVAVEGEAGRGLGRGAPGVVAAAATAASSSTASTSTATAQDEASGARCSSALVDEHRAGRDLDDPDRRSSRRTRRALALHERCGFRVVGDRKRLGKLDGVWRDAVVMERRSEVIDVTKVEAVVIRERVETVIDAVEEETGHVGVTVVEAIGHGRQRGVTHEYRGRVFESRFLPKALLTFVVEDARRASGRRRDRRRRAQRQRVGRRARLDDARSRTSRTTARAAARGGGGRDEDHRPR